MTPALAEKRLRRFLSDNGLTVSFLMNLKRHGRPGITDTKELIAWMVQKGFRLRTALYIAFYWADTPEQVQDPLFWNKWSSKWRQSLFIG